YPVVSSSDGGIDVRAVAIEHVVHQTGPRSRAEEFGLKADQATGGNNVIQAYTSLAVRHHVLQLAAARAQLFHHGALVGVLDIDGKLLIRLAKLAVNFLQNDFRAGNRQLITFAAHVFDQNAKVQFSTSRNLELVGVVG